ncbi:MAG: hypothetical protein M5U26_18175 [Planctomycetota bacterium]|nr:hypothetical protein [Planctomycetota bacterium]
MGQASSSRKAAPLRRSRDASRIVLLYGFPIQVRGAQGLFGPARPPRARPLLQVEVLRQRQVAGAASDGVSRVAGEGFELDARARRLSCYVSPGARPSEVREAVARLALLALGWLAERLGPARAAAPGGRVLLNLHGSAVLGRRGALVFCGHSGYGKTTIATKLLAPWPQLEWDLAIASLARPGAPRLLYVERGLRRGLSAAAGAAAPPLAGLFWLRQARRFGFRPLAAPEAAARLLPPLHFHAAPQAVRRRLRLLRELLEAVPCRELSFAKRRGPLVKLLREEGYL